MSDYDANHVIFSLQPKENRNKTIAAGHTVYDEVEFIQITPPGGNTVIRREVTEADKQNYKTRYEAWLEGREPPLEGTPLDLWPGIDAGMARTLQDMHIKTVQALAKQPDSVLERIGPGARALQNKARDWLKSAEDTGKVTEELNALRVENESLRERNGQLERRLQRLTDEINRPRQGRTSKDLQTLQELVA